MNEQKLFLTKNKYVILFLAAVVLTIAVRALPLLQGRPTVSVNRDDLSFWGKASMHSDEIVLKRGIYTVHVDNVTDIEYEFCLEEYPDEQGSLKGERKRVQPGQLSGEARFCVYDYNAGVSFYCHTVNEREKIWEVRELDAHIIYRPLMSFATSAVHVLVFYVILAALLLSLRYAARTKDPFERLIPLLTLLFILFICAPLFARFVVYSHDQEFHMGRIASLAAEIKALRLPARIGQTMQNGYGYPVSIFYGDLFLVPVALLYACGLPMWECYQLLFVQICVMTVIFAQFAFGEITGNRTDGFCLGLIYTGSVRLLANLFLRGAVGEGLAMAFLPLAALGFFRLFHTEERVRKQAVWPLVAGYTGIILSHTLTAVQAVWIAALLCLCMIRNLLKDGRFVLLLKSAGITALLTLWFTVPFVDYYIRHDVYAKDGGNLLDNLLQPANLLFPQSQFTAPGFAILLMLLTGICLLALSGNAREARCGIITGALAVLLLVMTTNLMPWKFLMDRLPALYDFIGGKVQFTHRFFTPATLLVCAFACEGIRVYRKAQPSGAMRYRAVLAALIAVTVYQGWGIMNGMMATNYYLSPVDAISTYADTLYLRADGEESLETEEMWRRIAQTDLLPDPGVEIDEKSVTRNGTAVSFTAVNETGGKAQVTLPVWNYFGYEATGDADGLRIDDGEYRKIRITLPERFSGTVTVAFREPVHWRVAEAVSLAAAVCCLWKLFVKRNGRRAASA